MPVIDSIVFVESSQSLGGSMLCLSRLLTHYKGRLDVALVTLLREPFQGFVPNDVHWEVVENDLPAIARSRYFSLFFELRMLAGFVRTFRRLRPRLVYLNNDTYSNRHAAAAAILMGIPYVLHARGDIPFSRLSRQVVQRSALNLAVSRYVKAQLDDLVRCTHKNIVVNDGVSIDPTALSLRCDPVEDRGLLFLHIGNFVGWKGQLLAVRAFVEFLAVSKASHQLHLIGHFDKADEEYLECKQLIDDRNLNDVIQVLGPVFPIDQKIAECDVVLNTSIRPEPFGLTVIEAMQMGKMVVAPSEGGPSETVEAGSSGFLFEPRNELALANALSEAADAVRCGVDTGLIKSRGRLYSLDVMLAAHEEVIAGVSEVLAPSVSAN